MHQRIALVDSYAQHFPEQDIVIAGGDRAAQGAFDFGQNSFEQRCAVLSPAPLHAIEAVMALAREARGDLPLIFG
jgi:hypothetical protein